MQIDFTEQNGKTEDYIIEAEERGKTMYKTIRLRGQVKELFFSSYLRSSLK